MPYLKIHLINQVRRCLGQNDERRLKGGARRR